MKSEKHRVYILTKRAIDILCASIGLIVLVPLFSLIALMIHIRLGPPILYRQTRTGRYGHPFIIYKFRTMGELKDVDGEPLPDELRLTRFGDRLRSTSLDDLPELWNIVKGEMSFIGPRPLLPEYLPLYSVRQSRRHEVRPGLTGWAQVHGRNAIPWEERFELDVWYVDNQCFRVDLEIILLTLRTVLFRKGISPEGRTTMERFRGRAF